jgi:hypothetical protein
MVQPVTKTALQQLTWSHQDYGATERPYACTALMDHTVIATVHDCPAGWSVRICCIPHGRHGAHEACETYEEAKVAVDLWVSALDIDPGD